VDKKTIEEGFSQFFKGIFEKTNLYKLWKNKTDKERVKWLI
jgi:hypothetical protein